MASLLGRVRAEALRLSGKALDTAFLEEMIPHHAGAVEMSHRAIRTSRTRS